MRAASLLAAVILVLFVAVQHNDPDALLWGAIYGLAAFWCALAGLRPDFLHRPLGRWAFLATFVAAGAGLVWYWPQTPEWWRKVVWWESETAREGMGMMIVLGGLAIAALAGLRHRH